MSNGKRIIPDQNICPLSPNGKHIPFGKEPVTCYFCAHRLYGVSEVTPPKPLESEKTFVREIFPESYLYDTKRGGFDVVDCIDKDRAMSIGYGKTEKEAWTDAATRQGFKPLEPPQETEQCPRCYSAVRYVRLWISGFTGNCTNPWHDSPEPKPAPQAEGLPVIYHPEIIGGFVWEHVAREAIAVAQAPLLQKIAELEGQAERLNQHMDAGVECERRDCSKALLAMAAVGICTPEEGYGTNSSWAISDLCRAVEKLREVEK